MNYNNNYLAAGITVYPKPFHRLPDRWIADDPPKFKAQLVLDLPISHHWVVGMDIPDIAIQYLMCFLKAV